MQPDLIVIGASAGGVEAMQTLVAALPVNFGATLFLVIHVAARGPLLMDRILDHSGPLPASYPEDGQPFERGRIYLAPPDHHLFLEGDCMRVVRTLPKVNWCRPAIDPLFQSAALHHGARVVGIVLTGHLADGSEGLRTIKQCGGLTVIQHPQDAAVPDMPRNALKHVEADYCLSLVKIGPLLERLVDNPAAFDVRATVDRKAENPVPPRAPAPIFFKETAYWEDTSHRE